MSVEIFPVVHVNEVSQALNQSEIAYDAGADGVYLIDHRNQDTDLLLQSFNAVADKDRYRFIGLNFLQLESAENAFWFVDSQFQSGDIIRLPDAIWADDAIPLKHELLKLRQHNQELSKILYLGGVAFKYTNTYTGDPEESIVQAKNLVSYVDVVTTSGKGTGMPPSIEKIRAMKQAIGDKKLAVASGISSENIHEYTGLFDQLLVSSSIEIEPYSGIFDQRKLKVLVELVHSL